MSDLLWLISQVSPPAKARAPAGKEADKSAQAGRAIEPPKTFVSLRQKKSLKTP